jgi:hypothetical protein
LSLETRLIDPGFFKLFRFDCHVCQSGVRNSNPDDKSHSSYRKSSKTDEIANGLKIVESKIFDGGEDTENEYDAGAKVLANNGYSGTHIDEITQ